MKIIIAKKGEEIRVSDQDYDWLNLWRWGVFKAGKGSHPYAWRDASARERREGLPVEISMHRQIMQFPNPPMVVDHINRDTLDNQRENLREVTPKENANNRLPISSRSTSKIPYVYQMQNKFWVATTYTDGKMKNVGSMFRTKEEAARAREVFLEDGTKVTPVNGGYEVKIFRENLEEMIEIIRREKGKTS